VISSANASQELEMELSKFHLHEGSYTNGDNLKAQTVLEV